MIIRITAIRTRRRRMITMRIRRRAMINKTRKNNKYKNDEEDGDGAS